MQNGEWRVRSVAAVEHFIIVGDDVRRL